MLKIPLNDLLTLDVEKFLILIKNLPSFENITILKFLQNKLFLLENLQ